MYIRIVEWRLGIPITLYSAQLHTHKVVSLVGIYRYVWIFNRSLTHVAAYVWIVCVFVCGTRLMGSRFFVASYHIITIYFSIAVIMRPYVQTGMENRTLLYLHLDIDTYRPTRWTTCDHNIHCDRICVCVCVCVCVYRVIDFIARI